MARLLLIVLELTFSVPWLEMPPPATAELPLTVAAGQRGLPRRGVVQAAAIAGGGVAADGAVGQRWSCPIPVAAEEYRRGVQSAAVGGGVAADGAVGERES